MQENTKHHSHNGKQYSKHLHGTMCPDAIRETETASRP